MWQQDGFSSASQAKHILQASYRIKPELKNKLESSIFGEGTPKLHWENSLDKNHSQTGEDKTPIGRRLRYSSLFVASNKDKALALGQKSQLSEKVPD